MLKPMLILSAAIYATFLIAGEDRGQLRQGLAHPQKAHLAPMPEAPMPETVVPARIEAAAAVSPVVAEIAKPADAAFDPAQMMPIVYVSADQVNVRQGPSTQDTVIGRLAKGEAALVVWSDDTGWTRIRIEGDGIEGYVSSRYLTSLPLTRAGF